MNKTVQEPYQTMIRSLIFKKLLPASFLLFSFTPKNAENSGGPVVRKVLTIVNPFQKLVINGDISVMLTDKPPGTVLIEGDEDDVNNIKYRIKNNELVINASKKKRPAQLKVYLSATTLKNMFINGDGDISSTGTIKTDDFHMWLNGNINVEINIIGRIRVDAFDDNDLLWRPVLMKMSK